MTMGSLDVAKQLKIYIQKKLFKLKPPDNSGLLISILQTCEKKSTRFTHSDFQNSGNILALANNDSYIYVIDFRMGKFWKLKQLESCTHIKFSECSESQLLVGKTSGILEVLNIDSGKVLAKLLGHHHPVRSVSFTENNVCISASKYEAIIWDLNDYSKLQVLSLAKQCVLKFAFFVPISNHILVCYDDDIIQIWQNGSFENLKQFQPSNWRNYSVKSLTFSRNGKVMAVSGYLPVLALFQLDIWKLLKIINLPDYINTVRKIQFISENFDGGCNRLLAILSGNGIIYFYNAQDNVLISELKSRCEISSFSLPVANAQYIACILCSGEVEVYDIPFFAMKNAKTVVEKAQEISDGTVQKLKLKNFCKKNGVSARIQMEKVLEIDKLKSVIKEYKEFPATYRATIWEKILKLPNNIQQYNSIVNHMVIVAFPDLQEQFPLEDKVSIRCLRHVLNNIATWCPFFAQVEFLPIFLFPFVKVFHKKPIACFELCCTIIVNWCQHWFEYHPLPPVNVLAIIDNMLMEHDSASLHHFSQCNVKPILYSWSLLESAFSEVLTANQWLMFWDHVFINEPSFLLCSVVAFIMLQKKHILLLTKLEEFYKFFHSQKPLDIKKFVDKTYHILNNTSGRNHPRQYLNEFTCLTCGSYPTFEEYPKEVVNFHVEHVNHLETQLNEMRNLKEDMLKNQRSKTYDDIEIKNEEERRMIEVEKACIQKIKTYQENLMAQQNELKTLRQELLDQENKIIANTRSKLRRRNNQLNAEKVKLLSDGLDVSEKINQVDVKNLEEAYKLRSLNVSRRDQDIEEDAATSLANPTFENQLFAAHQETMKLKRQIKKAKTDLHSPRKVDIALIMSTMNGLINKIKSELENEKHSTNYGSVKEHLKVHELERETRELQKEISQLLRLLSGKQGFINSPPACSSQACPNKTVRFSTNEF